MVRSHIGNVVCRKALCVRVASSPPTAPNFEFGFFLFLGCISGNEQMFHVKHLFVFVCATTVKILPKKALHFVAFVRLCGGNCRV